MTMPYPAPEKLMEVFGWDIPARRRQCYVRNPFPCNARCQLTGECAEAAEARRERQEGAVSEDDG